MSDSSIGNPSKEHLTFDDLQRRVRHYADGAQEVGQYLSSLSESSRMQLLHDEVIGTKATLLHVAAAEGKEGLVAKLIEWGAPVNAKDRDGETPLHWAAGRNSHQVIRNLIDGGAELEAKDRYAETPLMRAVSSAAAEAMLNLLEAGGDCQASNDKGVKVIDLIAFQASLQQMFQAWSAKDVFRNVIRRHQP